MGSHPGLAGTCSGGPVYGARRKSGSSAVWRCGAEASQERSCGPPAPGHPTKPTSDAAPRSAPVYGIAERFQERVRPFDELAVQRLRHGLHDLRALGPSPVLPEFCPEHLAFVREDSRLKRRRTVPSPGALSSPRVLARLITRQMISMGTTTGCCLPPGMAVCPPSQRFRG